MAVYNTKDFLAWLREEDKAEGVIVFDNTFHVEHYREGSLLDQFTASNSVTTEGRNQLLDIMFRNQTQLTDWYIGIIDNEDFTELTILDTMTYNPGWKEFEYYAEADRVPWLPGNAVDNVITNASPAVVTITEEGWLYGMFVTSDNGKMLSLGKLWATAPFDAVKHVVPDDTLRIFYSVRIQ